MGSLVPRCDACSAMVSSAEKGLSYENDTFTIGIRTGTEREVRCAGRGWPAPEIQPVPFVRDVRKAGDSPGEFNIWGTAADQVADGGPERHAASSYAGTEWAPAAHCAGRPGAAAPAPVGRDRGLCRGGR